MENVSITPDLDIHFADLMCDVELEHQFTLRDVLRAVMNYSQIPPELFSLILHCPPLGEFFQEAESKPFDPEAKDLDYL